MVEEMALTILSATKTLLTLEQIFLLVFSSRFGLVKQRIEEGSGQIGISAFRAMRLGRLLSTRLE